VSPSGNAEVVGRIIAAISRADLDAVLAETHSDFELTPLISTWPEPYRGHDGLRRWFGDTAQNWDRFELDVTELRELDDETVLAIVRWHGRPRGSTSDLDGSAAGIWRLRDGKAVSGTLYPDERRALEGAGPSAGH
jgi:ketosteroid isomerase-like protein